MKNYEEEERKWPWWNRAGEFRKPQGMPRTRWKNMKHKVRNKKSWLYSIMTKGVIGEKEVKELRKNLEV